MKMRTLIYIPIIHTSVDLGSVAKQVDERGIADFGEEFWTKHKETISGFWDSIVKYFADLEVRGFKIYQDSLVADGEVAQKIVEDAVKAGSKNYKIIDDLIKKGARLVQTEDLALVKKEKDKIVKISQAKTILSRIIALSWYKFTKLKNNLLKKRDSYIAQRINETLNDGQTGILFLGAYHDIIPNIAKDIRVVEVKDANKVRNYQKSLFSVGKNKDEFEELAKYLIAPVETERMNHPAEEADYAVSGLP